MEEDFTLIADHVAEKRNLVESWIKPKSGVRSDFEDEQKFFAEFTV